MESRSDDAGPAADHDDGVGGSVVRAAPATPGAARFPRSGERGRTRRMTGCRVSKRSVGRTLAGAAAGAAGLLILSAASVVASDSSEPPVFDGYLPELVMIPGRRADPRRFRRQVLRAGTGGRAAPRRLRAAIPDRQVRDHVRTVGPLLQWWRLRASPQQGVGPRGPPRHRRELGRRGPVPRLALGGDRGALPPADRGRVGVRGPSRRGAACQTAAALHRRGPGLGGGLFAGTAPDEEDETGGVRRRQRVRPVRYERQRLGVDGQLLAADLRNRRRFGLARELRRQGAAGRAPELHAELRAHDLQRRLLHRATAGEISAFAWSENHSAPFPGTAIPPRRHARTCSGHPRSLALRTKKRAWSHNTQRSTGVSTNVMIGSLKTTNSKETMIVIPIAKNNRNECL